MLGRRQMTDEMDVRRPGEIMRILCSFDQEAAIPSLARRLHKQVFQCLLAIRRVGTEIGQIRQVMRSRRHRTVNVRIDMAIQRLDAAGTELPPVFLHETRSSGEAQYEIKAGETVRTDIG